MPHYVFGDVQGCFDDLQRLLEIIHYAPHNDTLIFAGDIINRGPKSLDTLRFIKNQPNALVTLGNHDMYALAIGYHAVTYDGPHTLHAIFEADDAMALLNWLRHQPMLYRNDDLRFVVTHAGIPPQWSIDFAEQQAQLLEQCLQNSETFLTFLQAMEGDHPAVLHDAQNPMDQLRYITNALTRMRYCDARGRLELTVKSSNTSEIEGGYKPWYLWPNNHQDYDICFGHWAALNGMCPIPNIHALDTGCVYKGPLTAWCPETRVYHHT